MLGEFDAVQEISGESYCCEGQFVNEENCERHRGI